MKLEGTTICITGGNKGLGAELVKQLVERVESIYVIDRSEQIFQHEKIKYIRMDLAKEKPIDLPTFDIFVSNLGKNVGQKTMDEMSGDDVNEMIEININTHLWFLKTVKYGKFIFISSVLSFIGLEKYSLYCASKSFLRILNESLQREKKNTMIVYPYKIDTTMFSEIGDIWTLKASNVAKRIITGIEKDHKEIFIPYVFKLALILKAILPSFVLNFILFLVVKLFYKKSKLKTN